MSREVPGVGGQRRSPSPTTASQPSRSVYVMHLKPDLRKEPHARPSPKASALTSSAKSADV